MSAVIGKTKQHYIRSLKIELFLLISIFSLLLIMKGEIGFSFLGGFLSSFLPHCLLVYWIFFKKTTNNQYTIRELYQGEGLKWFVTILLVTLCLKLYASLHVVLFFVGYFVALFFNNVIPFILSKRTH